MKERTFTVKFTSLYFALGAVLLLAIMTAAVSYQLGNNRAVDRTQANTERNNDIHAEYRSQTQTELSRIQSDYDTACYNYQVLYDAYDKLYAKAGADSGAQKVMRPDGARGNENSCYRADNGQ